MTPQAIGAIVSEVIGQIEGKPKGGVAGRVAKWALKKTQSAVSPAKNVSRVMHLGWAAQGAQAMSESYFPRATLAVSVHIQGTRSAKIGKLYYLATAIAAGFRNDIAVSGKTFVANIDYTNKTVEVSVAYSASGLTAQGFEGVNSGLAKIKESPREEIFAINSFPEFMLPVGVNPNLTTDGQTQKVLTPTVDPKLKGGGNPYPDFDGISRATDLTALVTAALIGPCDTPAVPQAIQYKVGGSPSSSSSGQTLASPGSQSVTQTK